MNDDTTSKLNRRGFLTATGLTGVGATAGCLSSFTSSGPQAPPTVTDRPDAVYVPSHIEGMKMAGMRSAGDLRVGVFYSFPHRFWTVTGTNTTIQNIESNQTVHLMASVWDEATKTVLPAGGLTMAVTKNGNPVDERNMWQMLSQNMGFHFGDNVPLSGNGEYTVEVSVDPVAMRKTGAYQEKFGTKQATSVTFEFSQQTLNDEVMFRRLAEQQGQKGAVEKMQMEMLPLSATPKRANVPGSVIGSKRSGDAKFLATVLDSPPEGVPGDGAYFAVSPRTPYHGFPLPFMSLSASVTRDGASVFDNTLTQTLDPDLGVHYGAAVSSLQSGDELTLSVGAPPQVARHEGYETAFLSFDDVSMTVQ